MNSGQKGTSTKPNVNTSGQMDVEPQDAQPEEGFYPDYGEEQEIRQNSPANPRVSEKSEEAQEEA